MHSVKFYVVSENLVSRTYQHEAIQLAEGFRALGLEFFGNCDYWYDNDAKEYLIKKGASSQSDINIYTSQFLKFQNTEIKEFVNFKKVNILIDSDDGFQTLGNYFHSYFDVILKCHMLESFDHPKNFKPWAFGLTERLIQSITKYKNFDVEPATLVNYRVFYDTRYLARKKLDPLLECKYPITNWITDPYRPMSKEILKLEAEKRSYWWQTGCRHDEEYFQLLNKFRFTYCFGGPIIRRNNLTKFFPNSKVLLSAERRIGRVKVILGFRKNLINYQFDSWRFWESLLSNSIPLHCDFNISGFALPINPENGIHYLGLKEFDYQGFWERLSSIDSSALDKISEAGREFAITHYGPHAAAQRLLKYLNEL